MPYAPSVNYNPSPLFEGIASIGNSIERRAAMDQEEQMRRAALAQAWQIEQIRKQQQEQQFAGQMANAAADRAVRVFDINRPARQPTEQEARQAAAAGVALLPAGKDSLTPVKLPQPTLVTTPSSMPVPGGGRIIDDGTGNRQFVPDKEPPKQPAKSEADISFQTNAAAAKSALDELEKTIKTAGTYESSLFGDPKASADLDALPYRIAINTAKLMDPSSVAREGEVEAAKKFLIPVGFWATKDKALAAIKNHRAMVDDYVKTRTELRDPSQAGQPGVPDPSAASPSAAPAMSDQDQKAAAWARANPNDPRAAAIKQRLGIR